MKKNKIFLVTLPPITHRTSEENLGIEYLKSCLVEKKYEVEIIDAWLNELTIEEVYNKIINESEDILFVGLSSYMLNTTPTIELIKKLKKYNENIKIVCGGFGPTFYPNQYLMSQADFIIRGEGEKAICDLANSISQNKEPNDIANIGYIKNNQIVLNEMGHLINNLDFLPFPSRDNIELVKKRKSSVNMITSRGCSGNCDFCSVISFFRLANGKIWRTRSIKNIVDEIEELYKNGVTHIKMVDDSFVDGIRDEMWCKEFADEIEKRGIKVKLRGQIRADKVTDLILKDLKRAGFFSFACGIENGSQKALTRMNKFATLNDNIKALELFKKHNYIVQMGYILFDKETSFNELIENYEFMSKYDFTLTKGIFSEMYSTEGTKLNDKLKSDNKLNESNFENGNNKYLIEDKIVKKVYDSLKLWHKSHSYLYDMTIVPLTAPKAISDTAIEDFYNYAMTLKKKDLMFFRDVLKIVGEYPEVDIYNYIKKYISDTFDDYNDIQNKVKILYKKNDMIYNANNNPFL